MRRGTDTPRNAGDNGERTYAAENEGTSNEGTSCSFPAADTRLELEATATGVEPTALLSGTVLEAELSPPCPAPSQVDARGAGCVEGEAAGGGTGTAAEASAQAAAPRDCCECAPADVGAASCPSKFLLHVFLLHVHTPAGVCLSAMLACRLQVQDGCAWCVTLVGELCAGAL